MNNIWKYKRINYEYEGLQVYAAYMFGEFSHYCYREPVYQLTEKRTLKGIERKEVKLKGIYQYRSFYRWKNENGERITWREFFEEVKTQSK